MSPPQDGLGALFPDSVCWFPFALFAFSCGLTVLKTSVALLFFSPSLWTAPSLRSGSGTLIWLLYPLPKCISLPTQKALGLNYSRR